MAGKKRKPGKFEADLVKTYHQVSGKPKKARKKGFSTVLIILVVVIFLAALGAGAYLYFFSGVTPGLILNNVTVAGVNLYTKKDAVAGTIVGGTREAVTLFNKKGTEVEQPPRDANDANIRKNTIISRKYYLAALTDATKAFKITK